jgi:hypothetical protein
MSFIPYFGVLFGLIAVTWGLITGKNGGRKLALIGMGGIVCSVILYQGIYYKLYRERGGIYDDLRTQAAQADLNSAIPLIETYRLTHGEYPESLAVLKDSLPKDSLLGAISLYDPRITELKSNHKFFYYVRVGSDHYYLRGVAPDGKPFSPGALVPEVADGNGGLGLLTEAPRNPL